MIISAAIQRRLSVGATAVRSRARAQEAMQCEADKMT